MNEYEAGYDVMMSALIDLQYEVEQQRKCEREVTRCEEGLYYAKARLRAANDAVSRATLKSITAMEKCG